MICVDTLHDVPRVDNQGEVETPDSLRVSDDVELNPFCPGTYDTRGIVQTLNCYH